MKEDPQEASEVYILALSPKKQRTHRRGLSCFLSCFRERRSCDQEVTI